MYGARFHSAAGATPPAPPHSTPAGRVLTAASTAAVEHFQPSRLPEPVGGMGPAPSSVTSSPRPGSGSLRGLSFSKPLPLRFPPPAGALPARGEPRARRHDPRAPSRPHGARRPPARPLTFLLQGVGDDVQKATPAGQVMAERLRAEIPYVVQFVSSIGSDRQLADYEEGVARSAIALLGDLASVLPVRVHALRRFRPRPRPYPRAGGCRGVRAPPCPVPRSACTPRGRTACRCRNARCGALQQQRTRCSSMQL